MHNSRVLREWKIFDPRDPSTAAYGDDLLDATFIPRDKELLMVLGGQPGGQGATDLYCAYLPEGATSSAVGWKPIRDGAGHLVPLSKRRLSSPWDGKGGRLSFLLEGLEP
jgi:hypothetical protein